MYRDTDDAADASITQYSAAELEATAREAAEREAAYWYGSAENAEPAPAAAEQVRGPFEPLVTSPSPSASGSEIGGDPAAPAAPVGADPARVADLPTGDLPAGDTPTGDAAPPDGDDRHARKLEQIKDFYLTAEAIGDDNVDKHFDTLVAQQRELISEYFKDSKVTQAPAADASDAPASLSGTRICLCG